MILVGLVTCLWIVVAPSHSFPQMTLNAEGMMHSQASPSRFLLFFSCTKVDFNIHLPHELFPPIAHSCSHESHLPGESHHVMMTSSTWMDTNHNWYHWLISLLTQQQLPQFQILHLVYCDYAIECNIDNGLIASILSLLLYH